MIYRPIASRSLWDTWILPWRNEYHLFHLESQEDVWTHVGHAVSSDLIRWETLPSIPTRNTQPHWNRDVTLTGMVVPHQGRFYMFLGSIVEKVQVIGLYLSDDLVHWQPYPNNPIIRPAPPHYLCDPAKAEPYETVDWRDPNITYNENDGYYHALLCARLPLMDARHTGASVGHLRSKDLLNWESLPPIATLPTFYHAEVPDIFELEGTWYLTFNSHSIGGLRIHTPARDDTTGVYYLSGPAYKGPFTFKNHFHLFGSGNGKLQGYAGRSLPYRQQRIFYHHCHVKNPYRPALGVPKVIRANPDRSLYLEYMPLLETLETSTVLHSIDDIPLEIPDPKNPVPWRRHNKEIIGSADLANTTLKLADDMSDFHMQCNVNSSTANATGILMRAVRDNNIGQTKAVILWLDYEHQEIRIEIATHQNYVGWGHDISYVMGNSTASRCHDRCRMELEKSKEYHLRCFARDEHFEVYLDNRWVFSSVLSDAPKIGSVNLIVERGQACFSNTRLATIDSFSQ